MNPIHQTKRLRWTCGVALVALALLLPLPGAAQDGVLRSAKGQVERSDGDPPVWRPAGRGDVLAAGDRLRTGRDGRAEVVWQGTTIRLYGDSVLRLPQSDLGDGTRVELEDGSGLFDVEHREDGSFEVHTPEVVVSVKGTRFGVGLESLAQVWVYRGAVSVRGVVDTAREVMVREGFGAVGGAEAPARVLVLDHADPWDAWSDAPPPWRGARSAAAGEHDPAVRRAARERALALALKRDPALAERLDGLRAELHAALALETGPASLADPVDGVPLVDPLLDAATSDLELLLRSRFVEQVLSVPGQTLGVAVGSTGDVLDIVESTLNQTWQVDQDTLVSVLEGTGNLPAGLDTVVQASGLGEQEAATLLLGLLGP
ncbi:MAG: FecR domain-containing protein [Myxococcota bacterium]